MAKIKLYGDNAIVPSTAPASSSSQKIRLYDYTPTQVKTQNDVAAHPELHVMNPLVKGGPKLVDLNNPSRAVADFPVSNPITSAFKPSNLIESAKQVLPGASQEIQSLIDNPFNFKNDKGEYRKIEDVIPAMWKAIKEPVKQEAANIKALFNPDLNGDPLSADRVGVDLKAIAGAGKVLFSPISALFEGANAIPIIGSVTKLITVPFAAAGDAGADAANLLVDKLPIPQASKDKIKDGTKEIFSLAAQLALGKTGWDAKVLDTAKAKLVEKFGEKDAQTIVDKSVDLATQKKAHEIPTENPIPQEVRKATDLGFKTKEVPGTEASLEGFKTKPVPGTPKIETPAQYRPYIDEAKNYGINIEKGDLAKINEKVDALKAALESSPKKTLIKLGFDAPGMIGNDRLIADAKSYVNSRLDTFKTQAQKINEITQQPLKPAETTAPVEVKGPVKEKVVAKTEPAPKVEKPVKQAKVEETPPGVSKAAYDINKKLAAKGFEELPQEQLSKFDPIKKKEEIQKAADVISRNEQQAKDMASGRIPVEGAHPQVLFNAVKNKAIAEGDVATLRDLATSPIASERSVAAQTLGASGFDNGIAEGDPVKAMQDVIKAREEKASKLQHTKDISKAKEVGVKEIKKEISKTHTKESWTSFVETLKC